VTIGLSFLVALISWYVLEQPFLRLKSRFGDDIAARSELADGDSRAGPTS
jgi:peptidoglycan/LPS O-acetylase OafA/YrhL